MKINCPLFLFVLCSLVTASCQNYSGQQESQPVSIDTLWVSDMETIVSTESALLGQPRELVLMDDETLAVYDHAYKKIIIFNNEGEKLDEFGEVGEGPGEWDSMSGAADLNFEGNQFFAINRGRFLFDLYDKSGNHIRSIPFPRYLNYTHKTLLSDEQLLVTTDGRENALAVVMDLKEEGAILQRIGSPESEYSERRNLEQERVAYSNGEIPGSDLNNALAAKGNGGYVMFMNTMGELRYYSDEGELIFQTEIPSTIKTSLFEYVVEQNKEGRQHSVMSLEYARGIQVHDDLIYLFIPKPHPEAVGTDFRMLVYSLNGELLKHYVFADSEMESFLYDFAISNDNRMYFIDVMSSQILRLSSVID